MSVVDHFIGAKGKYSAYNVTPDDSIDLYAPIAEKVKAKSGKACKDL